MSIADLTDKDTIYVATKTPTTGASWGVIEGETGAVPKSCLVQTMTARESLAYGARDQRTTHMFYFSSNPSITLENRITWNGQIISVLGHYAEGRPGEDLLWIVEGEHEAARLES